VVTARDAAAIGTKDPTMSANKLTDTQLVLRSTAPPPEGAIDASDLKGGAIKKAAGKLLRDGFIEDVPAIPDPNPPRCSPPYIFAAAAGLTRFDSKPILPTMAGANQTHGRDALVALDGK
jgi:hypothetical protein